MRTLAWRWMATAALLAGTSGRAHAQLDEFKQTWGVHASYPEIVSGSFSIGTRTESFDGSHGGFAVIVEPGLNGGRLLMAREAGMGPGSWITAVGMLQTWNAPPTTRAGVTYFSLEQRITLSWFTVGFGTAFRVAGGSVNTATQVRSLAQLDPGQHWPMR